MPYIVCEKYLMWLFYSSNNLGWFACFRIQFLPDHIMIHSCLVCVCVFCFFLPPQQPCFLFFYHPNNPVHGSEGELAHGIVPWPKGMADFDVRSHTYGAYLKPRLRRATGENTKSVMQQAYNK